MATLDSTLGGASSNSYVDLAEADAIAANLPFAADWAALTDEEKTDGLIVATRWLETLNYTGERCTSTQRLKWPRKDAECDGQVSDCSSIPYAIKEAEVILAWQYVQEPKVVPWLSVVQLGTQHLLERTSSARKLTCSKLSTTNSTATNTTTIAATAPCPQSSKNSPGLRTCLAAGLARTQPAATASSVSLGTDV